MAALVDSKNYSPVCNEFVLEITKVAYRDDPYLSEEFYGMCRAGPEKFRNAIAPKAQNSLVGYFAQPQLDEQAATAVLEKELFLCHARYLVERGYNSRNTVSYHQSAANAFNVDTGRVQTSSVDVSFYADLTAGGIVGPLIPLSYIEVLKDTTDIAFDAKYYQLFAYSLALFAQTGYYREGYKVLPILGALMSPLKFKLFAFYPTAKEKMAAVPIVELDLDTNFHKLVILLGEWNQSTCSALTNPDIQVPDQTFIKGNVRIKDGKVLKCFDYRKVSNKNSVLQVDRRVPLQPYAWRPFEHVLDFKNPVTVDDSLVIVSYDKIVGNHQPTHVKHLLDLFLRVLDLHCMDIVHGDIRLANVIFKTEPILPSSSSSSSSSSSPSSSSSSSSSPSATLSCELIDFDFSGQPRS